jgi:hypothetical protein
LQDKINDHNFKHVHVINKDAVWTMVDGEKEFFRRDDVLSGHPMSGLRHYGPIFGDHRMIQTIYDDMQYVFALLKTKAESHEQHT